MAKIEYTEGVLCRDKGFAGTIVFFPIRRPSLGMNGKGLFQVSYPAVDRACGAGTWTLKRWTEAYDLKAPRKGQQFKAWVQL